ncbi:unnamed protein product [Sympodiomycopsis kandeliae]
MTRNKQEDDSKASQLKKSDQRSENPGGDLATWVMRTTRTVLLTQQYYWPLAFLTLAFDAALTVLIIKKVAYTEIDFSTYMQQVDVFLKGQRDYTQITGDTGPCVYPAGHLYVYSLIHNLTDGGDKLRLAQYLFGAMYLVSQSFIFVLYYLSEAPPIVLPFLVLSKRLHSIYALRLFNDGIAMTVMWASIVLLTRRKYNLAVIATSMALSVKMNILLFMPGLAITLARSQTLISNVISLFLYITTQVLLSIPFTLDYPSEYLTSAFDLGRQFLYKWTVNLRFLSEEMFLDQRISTTLLIVHGSLLVAFAWFKWTPFAQQGPAWIQKQFSTKETLSPKYIVLTLFTSNLIGILCARSLHYQFYSWYAQTIPLLVWYSTLPLPIKLLIPPVLEYSWNVFPSTSLSSGLLCVTNGVLVFGMWRT